VSCNPLETNYLVIQGEVVQIETLRYTPAGIPLLSLVVGHSSEQIEADMPRRVECDVSAMILGSLAEKSQSIKVGDKLKVSGFLAKRSLKSTQLVLHIKALEKI
jgi:primosomal replication protein N